MTHSPCHRLAVLSLRGQSSAFYPGSPLLPFRYGTTIIKRHLLQATKHSLSGHEEDPPSAKVEEPLWRRDSRFNLRGAHRHPEATNPRPSAGQPPDRIPFDSVSGDPLDDALNIEHGVSGHIEDTPPTRESTMTEIERKAFKRLFESLVKREDAEKSSFSSSSARTQLPDENNTENQPSVVRFEDEAVLEDDLDFGIHYQDPDSAAATREAQSGAQIGSYPRDLHGVAMQTQLELAQQRQRNQTRHRLENEGISYDPVFADQRRAMRRIETSLYKAQSDVELWQILEQELFTRLRLLDHKQQAVRGTAEAAKTSTAAGKGKSKRRRPQQDTTLATNQSVEDTEALPALPTNAYSSLFLLAGRLLCRRAAYTPLAASLLSAIKSHSLTSFVLGTSTALYNELLAYRWRVLADLGSLIPLLREMNSSGIPMNEATLSILDDISLYRFRAQRGDFGAGAQSVEGMLGRESEGYEIGRWKRFIKRQLDKQALDRSYRAEAERRMTEDGTFADDDDDSDVRLAG